MADWLHERPLRWMAIVVFGSRFAAAAVIHPAAMIMTPLRYLWRLRAGARARGGNRGCWLLCDGCTWAQLDISDDPRDSRNVPGAAGCTLKLRLGSRRTDQVHRPFLRIDRVVA